MRRGSAPPARIAPPPADAPVHGRILGTHAYDGASQAETLFDAASGELLVRLVLSRTAR